MKKVVALVGSLRKESLNRSIFEFYKDKFSDQVQLQEGFYAELPLFNEDTDAPEALQELSQQIQDSDGVIFFTPEYNYSIPGGLKNAIDWLSRCDPQPFSGKPAAVIGATPGKIGTARVQYHLRQVGLALGLNFLPKPEIMIGETSAKFQDGELKDEGTEKRLKKHCDAFCDWIDQFKK